MLSSLGQAGRENSYAKNNTMKRCAKGTRLKIDSWLFDSHSPADDGERLDKLAHGSHVCLRTLEGSLFRKKREHVRNSKTLYW